MENAANLPVNWMLINAALNKKSITLIKRNGLNMKENIAILGV